MGRYRRNAINRVPTISYMNRIDGYRVMVRAGVVARRGRDPRGGGKEESGRLFKGRWEEEVVALEDHQ
jgi:hypothetical protein